jgi:2'-5' RNA ligase
MRAFIAIDLPEDHKDRLAMLRANIPGATWVRREGYHLTLRFLGDAVSETDLPKLIAVLSAIQQSPFEIVLAGVGRFPPGERQAARAVWAGIQGSNALNALYRQVEAALVPLGYPPEERAFSPHLTLARLKSPKTQPESISFLRKHASFSADPFVVQAFHLIQSMLTPAGAIYHNLATFPLR